MKFNAAEDGFAIGNSAPEDGWNADEIVYYKLMLSPTSANRLDFRFDPASGTTSGVSIRDFATSVLNGNAVVTRSLTVMEIAPHIRATRPCYVVVELAGPSNWYFLPGHPAILTAEERSDQYVDMTYVTTNRFSHFAPGQSDEDPGSSACRIIYFAILDPRPTAAGQTDPFSYFIQLDSESGQRVALIIDPDIKNNGGDND